MATTLSAGAVTIFLHDDMVQADEYSWSPVEQRTERTITGGLVVQTAARIAGRPITLSGSDERSGWVDRVTLGQCVAWAEVPGQVMTLVLGGVGRSVIWRHQDTAIEAEPIADYSDPAATDFYRATLRFTQV